MERFQKLDFSRIFFHSSNFPDMNDDFSSALLKLGINCLKISRMNGMLNEVPLEVRIGETSWVEVIDGGEVQVKEQAGRRIIGNGLQNEIKRIRGIGIEAYDPNDKSAQRQNNGASILQTLILSPSRSRHIKNLFITIYDLFKFVILTSYEWFLNLSFVKKVLVSRTWVIMMRALGRGAKWVRLAWHGTKGEDARDERMRAQRTLALEREKRDLEQRIQQQRIQDEARLRRNQAPINSIKDHIEGDEDYNEDEDEDWDEEGSEDELEDDGLEDRRERMFSPTPGPEEFEEEPDYNSLVELARSDFNRMMSNGELGGNDSSEGLRNRFITSDQGSSCSTSQNQNFSEIFLAHFSNPIGNPLTRRNYQQRISQGSNFNPISFSSALVRNSASSSASTSSAASTSNMMETLSIGGAGNLFSSHQLQERNQRMIEEENRRNLIEVMRARRIPLGSNDAAGGMDYEKERMRTCVVCCTDER